MIVGPTASGKSDLAIKIAKKINGEIISADSRQVYKGMDIGTGKISKKEQKNIPHYLIDVVSPKKQFTADDYLKIGRKALDKIIKKGKVPIIVGGTGFYIDALLGRIKLASVPPNKKLRAKLEKQTSEQLFKQLSKLDPKRAGTIDWHNKRRLVRAIEIAMANKISDAKYEIPDTKYDQIWIGLNPKKEFLKERIIKRFDQWIKKGLIKEVKRLRKNGLSWKRIESFGLEYKYIAYYLIGKVGFEEMRQKSLKDLVQYSKRQMTWFKRNKDIHWITSQKAIKLVDKFL